MTWRRGERGGMTAGAKVEESHVENHIMYRSHRSFLLGSASSTHGMEGRSEESVRVEGT